MRGKWGPTMRPGFRPTWWCPSPPPWVQLLQTLAQRNRLNLKLAIYIFPHWLFRDEAAEKQTIHNTDLKTIMIGVETLPEPLLVASSPPLTSSPSSPWWSWSSLYLDYEIVEVTYINISLVIHWVESHELPMMIVTIFILPLWWIFCWDDLWDVKWYLFLVYW
jgi:hypothetical protein